IDADAEAEPDDGATDKAQVDHVGQVGTVGPRTTTRQGRTRPVGQVRPVRCDLQGHGDRDRSGGRAGVAPARAAPGLAVRDRRCRDPDRYDVTVDVTNTDKTRSGLMASALQSGTLSVLGGPPVDLNGRIIGITMGGPDAVPTSPGTRSPSTPRSRTPGG